MNNQNKFPMPPKTWPQDYKDYLNEPIKSHRLFLMMWSLLLLFTVLGLMGTLYLIPAYGDKHAKWYNDIFFENGLWESIQALSLLLASMILAIGMARWSSLFKPRGSFLIPLLFCLLFFIAAGEEDSWGLLAVTPRPAYDPPSPYNLHHQYFFGLNLSQGAHIALQLLFIFYATLLPLLAFFFKPARYMVDRWNIPIPHAAFVPFGLFTAWMIGPWPLDHLFHVTQFPKDWSQSEVLETIFYLIAFGGCILQYLKWKDRSEWIK
jgi:hypothetical protein